MSQVSNYYERYWTQDGFNPEGPMDRRIWALLERHVAPSTRCLDIGCGDGQTYGGWVAARAARYVGYDVSSAGVERARARGLGARVTTDASDLPEPDGAFDLAICNEVLEHLFDPLAAVREIRRVLAPGGVLVCTVPNVAYWRRRIDLMAFGRWNPLGDDRSVSEPWRDPHLRFFTPSTLRAMLEAGGLGDVRVGGHGGALVRDVPLLRRLRRSDQGSPAYLSAQRRLPSLLGWGLHASAVRPPG